MPPTEPRSPQPDSRLSGPLGQQSEERPALFVYGSLQFPEVLHALLDRVPESEPAVAIGWRVAALRDRVYPALVRGSEAATGLLLRGLSNANWKLLDAFEDEIYNLQQLELNSAGRGWCYVYEGDAIALPDNWNADEFQEQHLSSYVDRCRRWRATYEGGRRESD